MVSPFRSSSRLSRLSYAKQLDFLGRIDTPQLGASAALLFFRVLQDLPPFRLTCGKRRVNALCGEPCINTRLTSSCP